MNLPVFGAHNDSNISGEPLQYTTSSFVPNLLEITLMRCSFEEN